MGEPRPTMNFGGSEPQIDPRDQEELQKFVQMKQAEAATFEHILKYNQMCFELCVDQPGAKLSSSQRDCVKNCYGRFMDAQKVIVERRQQLEPREFVLFTASSSRADRPDVVSLSAC